MWKTSNPIKKPQVQPQNRKVAGMFQDEQGRIWSAEAIDQLIVGHVHGKFTFTPTAIYLSHLPNLSKITSDEAESVFNMVIQKTEPPFIDWSSKPSSDAKVQEILTKINGVMDDERVKYLSGLSGRR